MRSTGSGHGALVPPLGGDGGNGAGGAPIMTPFRRALTHTLAALFGCVTSDVAADPPARGGANMAKKLFRNPKSEA